ncbi:3-hydroxyacyl-ACP dehydratase FabZ family protein [Micromonospora sp. CPCC 206061]|uniref:3-hydroxyacyl-ACP dehydratase FabZ family protein n=1 Tax=Micromonospora sp. CPCC 206061 TaxID=3122410 RepID=UPI002FEF3EA5
MSAEAAQTAEAAETAQTDTGWAPVPVPAFAAPLPALDALRVRHSTYGIEIHARTAVRAGDPNLAGHFPGFPVFPGVFLVECLRQAVDAAFSRQEGRAALLRVVRSARFLAPALPGDELSLVAGATAEAPGRWRVAAEWRRRDGVVVARAVAMFDEVVPDE